MTNGAPFDNSTGAASPTITRAIRVYTAMVLSIYVNHTSGRWQPDLVLLDCDHQGSFGGMGQQFARFSYIPDPEPQKYENNAIQVIRNHSCLPTDAQWYK